MREARLETFLDALARTVAARALTGAPVTRLQEAIFDRAARTDATVPRGPAARPGTSEREPVDAFVSANLPAALDALAGRGDDLSAVGQAFHALTDDLVWAQRPAAPDEARGFREGHANATVVGIDGLEMRDDIRVGASLVGPGVPYPAHRHPPEELYLVLSEGQWRNSERDWWRPGVGGLVHNPPGIEHAMRAGDESPLLAIWCLLIDEGGSRAR
jgi:quercetin dioxygenase-like cupin family protein